MSTNKRGRLRPTHEWDLLVPLFEWPEQKRYEEIRPLVLFDVSVAERAEEVGISQSTLYRKLGGFEAEGMESLFASQTARKRKLPPTVRRFIVDLKAEHPPFNLNEIANVVQACFGRKPDVRSVARVLAEEPVPLKIVRNYPPYHEIADPREGRAAIVELRLSGWSAKAIAGYLGVHKATVYRALQRWKERGFEGLADGSPGRPPGVRKADFVAVEAIRKLAQNPGLGAFRVHAAMKQMRFDLSRATCGRILAMIRQVYGYDEKPEGGSRVTQAAMPFAASARHEVWSADVRHLDMVDESLVGSKAYAVTVMDNYSRAILSSAVTRRQNLSAFLSILYRAVARYGAPKTLVTDSGSVFLANRAKALYAKLGISKEEIEKERPWQNYSETTFGIQQRMADWHFQKAQSWAELVEAHDRFVSDYNAQSHFAHQRREDGRRSPGEVLSWVLGIRFHPRDLQRAFFSERFSRVLDASGYATLMRWRLYGEEALAGKEADLWLLENTLTLEHAGEPLSAYEVAHDAAGSPDDARGRSGRLAAVRKPILFETSYVAGQMRLFGLAETLGEDGWLKVLRLDDYAPRISRQPEMLQQVLFTYTDAI
ncbi:MAG TPA: helix-turn-helix domain-containing protein [Rubrobacteraceae bacterium]|jgi:putative transposase|nr:helix-turn-helix domain-containing protein [Rubrobacteraceae bacterium]